MLTDNRSDCIHRKVCVSVYKKRKCLTDCEQYIKEIAPSASNNSAMVSCPKWHLGGKCWGDPWKEVCPAEPCRVAHHQ